jgi:hypothetical protein
VRERTQHHLCLRVERRKRRGQLRERDARRLKGKPARSGTSSRRALRTHDEPSHSASELK